MHYLFFMYFGFDELCLLPFHERRKIYSWPKVIYACKVFPWDLRQTGRAMRRYALVLSIPNAWLVGWRGVPWACVLKWVLRGNFLKNKMQLQLRALFIYPAKHGQRTPNEGINQRYLKNWADVADKICFGHT